MKKRYYLLVSFLLLSTTWADSWSRTNREVSYHFETTKCIQYEKVERVYRDNLGEVFFECFENGKKLFRINDVYSEKVIISPDKKYYLGLSNMGIYLNAFWVIDRTGKQIAGSDHTYNKSGLKAPHCCEKSVTVTRNWVSFEEKPIVFEYTGNKLINIKVKSCDGKILNLNDFSNFNQVSP